MAELLFCVLFVFVSVNQILLPRLIIDSYVECSGILPVSTNLFIWLFIFCSSLFCVFCYFFEHFLSLKQE